MTEFAKNAPPEMIPVFLKTCETLKASKGICSMIDCRLCPGAARYNNDESCQDNGWTDYKGPSLPNSITEASAKAFINSHAKPARKPKSSADIPDHLQSLINDAEARTKVAVHGIEDLNKRLKVARQQRDVLKDQLTAAKKRVKAIMAKGKK